MKVLIVDDSRAMRNIITKAMQSTGYANANFNYASDGEAALKTIQTERPDLVLCDMHMPGKNGLEVLRELRGANDLTKVIIISIDEDEATVSNIIEAGVTSFLRKPFTPDQLGRVVADMVGAAPIIQNNGDRQFAHDVAATIFTLEHVLGGLAKMEVKFNKTGLDDIDYGLSPFYGGTLENDENQVVIALFLDIVAANTMAAIIGRRPIAEALNAAKNRRLDELTQQLLLAFLALFCGLCKPGDSGQLLNVHKEMLLERPALRLREYIHHRRNSTLTYAIQCGANQCGRSVIVFPAP